MASSAAFWLVFTCGDLLPTGGVLALVAVLRFPALLLLNRAGTFVLACLKINAAFLTLGFKAKLLRKCTI